MNLPTANEARKLSKNGLLESIHLEIRDATRHGRQEARCRYRGCDPLILEEVIKYLKDSGYNASKNKDIEVVYWPSAMEFDCLDITWGDNLNKSKYLELNKNG